MIHLLADTPLPFRAVNSLRGAGIDSLEELLTMMPARWGHGGDLTPLSGLVVGDTVTVIAEIVSTESRPMRSKRGMEILDVVVADAEEQRLHMTFFGRFHTIRWRQRSLQAGQTMAFTGKVSEYRGQLQLTHPRMQELPDDMGEFGDEDALERVAGPPPVYDVKPFAAARLTHKTVAQTIQLALDAGMHRDLEDPVPADLTARLGVPVLAEAIELIHRPKNYDETERGQSYFRVSEALTLQALLAQRRAAEAERAAPPLTDEGPAVPALRERLPFTLTEEQERVAGLLTDRISAASPLNTLLQGDVGSGKTVIALLAMLRAVDSGHQAVLLAPTEVLARQHFETITSLLADLVPGPLDPADASAGPRGPGGEVRVRPVLLTGSLRTAERRQALLDIASGTADVVVGTHALLGEDADFAALGLVVIDEQHRFGVDQREAMRRKGPADLVPHLLVMTATPIPRTVAMTVFGDLDLVSLRGRPGGRGEVASFVVNESKPAWVARMWERAREEVARGGQVFVVCTRIGDDEEPGAAPAAAGGDAPPAHSVRDVHERLTAAEELAGLRIAMLHSRIDDAEKQSVMARFAAGDLDLLVATTVVEVGIDVPSATMIIVMDADRFGVSQLHQLRGRVGRGRADALAIYATQRDPGTGGSERLEQIARNHDGFELAQIDLTHRSEGDVLGVSQSGGNTSLRLLKVARDEDIITAARETARGLIATDPHLLEQPALEFQVARAAADEQTGYIERS